MNIAYLIDDTGISASTRVALAQADLLIERGHRVTIVTTGAPVTWRSSRAEWRYVDDFREYDTRADDRVMRTAEEIIAAGIVVDDELYRGRIPRENDPLRVLLAGDSQVEDNGIEDAYGAAAHARWFHQKFDLVRVSPFVPSRQEPLDTVQEFHVALTTGEMTRLMHSCDVLIAPKRREAFVDLTCAEAMASGLACVITDTIAHAYAEKRDFARFAPENNSVELGERLIELLGDDGGRNRLRVRSREVAQQWRSEHVAERLEATMKAL